MILFDLFLAVKPTTSTDSHTVPSSRFTRPSTNIETISPATPQVVETQVFTRAPQMTQQRNSNSNSTIETLARQINGNDTSSTNGQSTVVVKDTKVIPSTELIGAVTRAKDGSYSSSECEKKT